MKSNPKAINRFNPNTRKLTAFAALAMFSLLPSSCSLFEDDNDKEEGGSNVSAVEAYALYNFNGNTNCIGQTSTVGVANNARFVQSFDGSRAIEIAANGQLSFPEAMIDCRNFTVSFWTKDCFDGHIFHVESTASYNICFTLGVINGRLKFAQSDYNCIYQYKNITAYSNNLMEGWHHITITSDNGTSVLYVDGTQTDQLNENGISCYGKGLKIVFGGDLDDPYLPGDVRTIDNLRFYHTTLQAGDVRKIYKAEAPSGFTPGTGNNAANVANNALYAYFKMDGNTSNATHSSLTPVLSGTSFVDSYDGTKALKIPIDGSLTIPDGMIDQECSSICFWVKDLYDGHVFHVANNHNSYSLGFTLAVVDGHLKFVRDPYNCCYQYAYKPAFNNSTLEGWHHIAIVSTGSYNGNSKLYIDGVLADQQSDGDVGVHKGYSFVMGGSLDKPNLNATTITIDNLRVYKHRAITAEEVKDIYDFER